MIPSQQAQVCYYRVNQAQVQVQAEPLLVDSSI